MSRRFSFDEEDGHPSSPPPYAAPYLSSSQDPPPAPRHHQNPTSSYRLPPINTEKPSDQGELTYSTSNRTASTTTPGADYLGDSAVGGGISGLAYGVSHQHQRESGLEAIRETERFQQHYPDERAFQTLGTDTPYIPEPPAHEHRSSQQRGTSLPPSSPEHRMSQARDPFASPAPSRHSNPFDDHRISPLPSPGRLTPRGNPSTASIPLNEYVPRDAFATPRSYSDHPYPQRSSAWDARISRTDIHPDDIYDDDGDDMMHATRPARRSMLGLNAGAQSHTSSNVSRGAGAASTGGVLGALGGLVGRKVTPASSSRDASGQYGPVGGTSAEHYQEEKSEWLDKETSGRKRLRWFVGVVVALVIIGAIVGGIVGGLKRSHSDSGSKSTATAKEDDSSGDLDKNSAEIKKLMNNPDLHKVMPGIDYTPFNAQYPACIENPPSQNNVTRDVAVLSQLTNTLRLYGTDCNQTEMVLHAIDKLELSGFKIWLGVWLDKNQTTVDRGIDAMHDILSKHGASPFAGLVMGNEVLFRKEMTEDQIGQILDEAKKFLGDNDMDLPIATSDLGDAWTSTLAAKVDVLMANVHPFFAGVTADKAAGWTYSFWTGHNVPLTANTKTKNVVSEVGWPSAGGIDCGESQETCTDGSKAGIDEMNTFMGSYICQSLANGTDFFWFEAFDEPWKESLNEPGKEWEDKWGLMDPGRKLKPGLKIPDCGGKGI